MPQQKPAGEFKKTSLELTKDQYFFLREKALALEKKQNQPVAIATLIRELVEKDRLQWLKHEKQN